MVFPVRIDEQLPVAGAAVAGQAEVAVFAEGLMSGLDKFVAPMAPEFQILLVTLASAGQMHFR
jgi:hypothetical protein